MAGLQEAFQAAAAAAFSAAGNVKETVTLRKKTDASPVYDPVTDIITDPHTDYSVSAIPSGYDSNEVDGVVILDTDEKLKILVSALAVSPAKGDLIFRSSVRWEIIGIHKDPADAVWTLQIRRP